MSELVSALPPSILPIDSRINHLNNELMQKDVTTMIPDSGASNHYLREEITLLCNDVKDNKDPTITLPDLSTLTANKNALLSLPDEWANMQKLDMYYTI